MIHELEISTELIQLIQPNQAWHYKIVPFNEDQGVVSFFSDNDSNRSELALILGKEVKIEIIDDERLTKLLSRYYRKADSTQTNTVRKLEVGPDFLNDIISEAKQTKSSDIHIEALEEKCRIRYRIDGKLIERIIVKKEDYPELINKVKILSHLDIAEKRLPQDGRISFKYKTEKFDLRVSVLPTMYGEKIVLRILGSDAKEIVLKDIGLDEEGYLKYLKGIQKPHGVVIISGPTGSGKTTTLYATLNFLNNKDRNILTIEDPIEYTLDGINQVQLKEDIGFDFPKALRTFLRQDPDIIMVGEIRDKETAEMAIRASLTGHLVLSTIHTNSAIGTLSRLMDMDIPDFLIADTLNISVAQRLVRLLCPSCKRLTTIEERQVPIKYKLKSDRKIYGAGACTDCHYTGYKGRKAVFEILLITDEVKEAIKLKNYTYIAEQNDYQTIAGSCFQLLVDGETSYEEIYPFLLS